MDKAKQDLELIRKAALAHPNRCELARRAGISPGQLSRIISGKSKNPLHATIKGLHDALAEVSADFVPGNPPWPDRIATDPVIHVQVEPEPVKGLMPLRHAVLNDEPPYYPTKRVRQSELSLIISRRSSSPFARAKIAREELATLATQFPEVNPHRVRLEAIINSLDMAIREMKE